MYLNYLGNYVPNTWNYEHGCSHCTDDVLDLSQLNVSALNKQFSFFFLLVSSEAVENVNYAASPGTLERVKHCRDLSAKHIYQSSLKASRAKPRFSYFYKWARGLLLPLMSSQEQHSMNLLLLLDLFKRSTSARETTLGGRGSSARLWCRIWLLGFPKGLI